MKRAVVLSRKSEFYPLPVICGVFPIDEGRPLESQSRIERWKEEFMGRFPEFRQSTFIEEYTEII